MLRCYTAESGSRLRLRPKKRCRGERLALDNDTVIVCAGGILPTAMLKAMGVEVETKYGSA